MKNIKLFEEFWPFRNKKEVSQESPKDKYSMIKTDDTSLIPFDKFHPGREIKEIVNKKINLLEQDSEFQNIMEMIRKGDIKKANQSEVRDFFKHGSNQGKLMLSDDRIIKVVPARTWEDRTGDYDIYYVMKVDEKNLGYISYNNYREVLKAIDQYNKF